ncbi:MAG: MBL fold metallo-hydrolase [Clostridia bacterium]|nr:MBL fold metallo-hydrolase [Clostridia bacterium]
MAKFCPFFSSSEGNSSYIECREGAILVDAGVSFKKLLAAARAVGGLERVRAVAITHTHNDHTVGLHPLLAKLKIPVIATEQTASVLAQENKFLPDTKVIIANEDKQDVFGIEIKSFSTSHDAEGSCGYSFYLPEGKKISVCTDLGVVTDSVRAAIEKSDLLLFESNHDIEMLKKGPYPPHLKVRILSDNGHISNNACSAELGSLLQKGTTRFILGHLSQHNNIPMLAKKTAEAALIDIGAENEKDYKLSIAAPFGNGVSII